jgi:small subunit ribosomal protein S15e
MLIGVKSKHQLSERSRMSEVFPKKKPFKKQIYRGVELDKLLEMNMDSVVKLMKSRAQRRFRHGIHGKYDRLIKKLRVAKKDAVAGEKPKGVKTHLRNAIIVPEMCGSIVDVYGGKYWNPVEVKADMVGHYLAEFSMTYKPIRHGKVGHGATRSSKFTSLR